MIHLKKAESDVKVLGRGGTDFQPVINFYEEHKEYDGLIIFTDGMASEPKIPTRRRILWVLFNRACYDRFSLTPKYIYNTKNIWQKQY